MSLKKDGTILINSENFVRGIAKSPYLGIQQMVNLDIHSRPGALRIARELSKESGATVDDRIRFGGIDTSGAFYGLGSGGTLFSRSNSGTWSSANDFGTTDDGGFVWKNYFIALRSTSSAIAEAYGPLTGGTAAERSFTSISFNHGNTASFVSLVTKDDKVFFGADNVLHELLQNDGQDFDPTSSGTYTLNEEVLILPEDVSIISITEIETNIVVGTSKAGSSTLADIFIWDPNKAGSDAASPDRRISLGGDGVNLMINHDNLLNCILGNGADYKLTDLTSIERLLRVNDISNDPDTKYDFTLKGEQIAIHDAGVVFGLTKVAEEPSIYLYKNGAVTSLTTSQGQVSAGIKIGRVLSLGDEELLVAWENQSDSSYGVDVTSTTSRYQGYSAYFVSQMYNVGSDMRDRTYQHIGFTLGKNLSADQGIRIKYRTDLSDSWTTIGTWDYDTIGAVSAYEAQANLPSDLTNLQIRVEMTTGTSDTTPDLLSVYVM